MPEIDSYNGVRTFVKLVVSLCRFYDRHKIAIIAAVPGDVVLALQSLDLACAALLALNDAGPN